MHIKRSNPMTSFALSVALCLMVSPSYAVSEYQLDTQGKSAHEALYKIADQADKGMIIEAPDERLSIDIAAKTAYSAARQIAENAGYALHYLDDTFTIRPEPASKRKAHKATTPQSQALSKRQSEKFSLTLRNTPVQEAFEMLAKRGRINLLLAPDVSGSVSANLYDVDLESAIDSVAHAAGLVVSHNRQGIYISNSSNVLTAALQGSRMQVKSFKIQYTDVSAVESIMRQYLSENGSLTSLADRSMIIARDSPKIIRELKSLLLKIDRQPRQIMIEAKILEITLKDEETFGIDWQSARGDGNFGTQQFASRNTAGLFLELVGSDLNAYMNALRVSGRVRTLSTPKLLVLEDQDAEVIVGNKLGYRTISTNGTTSTESIEFLDSGIILRVKASVDGQDRILLDVHPEVSTGSLVDGLPQQTTTEVTTSLLAKSGDEIFIGGLLSNKQTEDKSSVPGLSGVPVIGALFKKSKDIEERTETVIIIKPRLVQDTRDELEPMAELLESDSWFYQQLPAIQLVAGCVNNYCSN